MRESTAYLGADGRIGQRSASSPEIDRRDSTQIDRPQLVTEDDRVQRLAGLSCRDRHFPRISRASGRDGADRRHPGSVERITRNDQRTAGARLLMTDRRFQVDQDDVPAPHLCHVSGASRRARPARMRSRASHRGRPGPPQRRPIDRIRPDRSRRGRAARRPTRRRHPGCPRRRTAPTSPERDAPWPRRGCTSASPGLSWTHYMDVSFGRQRVHGTRAREVGAARLPSPSPAIDRHVPAEPRSREDPGS